VAIMVAGIALMAIGSFGIGAAVLLEIKTDEPIYKILMKVFPWVFGVGAILLGIALAGG